MSITFLMHGGQIGGNILDHGGGRENKLENAIINLLKPKSKARGRICKALLVSLIPQINRTWIQMVSFELEYIAVIYDNYKRIPKFICYSIQEVEISNLPPDNPVFQQFFFFGERL